MTTLLMRLSGPMQSWGTQSRFTVRDTGREPSKSGVIGLICAALGRPRTAPVDDLVRLRMGVRVDREGIVMRDYHTAGGAPAGERYGVATVTGDQRPVQSSRYYLADASFLVALEGGEEDRPLLEQIDEALRAPRWQLFLGRKSCVPGEPIPLPKEPPLGPPIREEDLRTALISYPWPEDAQRLRFVFEDPEGEELRNDVPISFEIGNRQYAARFVRTEIIINPALQDARR